MKRLIELLVDTPYHLQGKSDIAIKGIAYHSAKVKPGHLFVALNGFQTSGKKYVSEAIQRGASAIVSDSQIVLNKIQRKHLGKITTIQTDSPRKLLATVANRYYDFPSSKLSLIGITGTDGKTTTSYMIKSIIEASGQKTGLLGTIKYFNGRTDLPAPNTTPESLDFISFLHNLVKQKIKYCVSEVSSHALALGRVYGLDFTIAVFTNLSKDHLDFHKTMKNYRAAKLLLFQNLSSSATAVLNHDDPFTKQILKNTCAQPLFYSIQQPVDIFAKIYRYHKNATDVSIHFQNHAHSYNLQLPIAGYHNIYNMLAAAATATALKINKHDIIKGLEHLPVIPGRLQRVESHKGVDIYIDYAHTEKALSNAIDTLKHITVGKVIVVFGCGGNRDRLKRPKMGCCASRLSDYVIITSDNPRNENPLSIINDIIKGFVRKNYEIIVDRKNAIEKAIRIAQPGDSVLIAGKGHENYQIIGNMKKKFSDYAVIQAVNKST